MSETPVSAKIRYCKLGIYAAQVQVVTAICPKSMATRSVQYFSGSI